MRTGRRLIYSRNHLPHAMKIQPSPRLTRAMTLVEVLTLVSIIVILIGLLLPAITKPTRCGGARIKCVNNLKQIGLAFKVFANDNDDKFPAQISPGIIIDGVDISKTTAGANAAYAMFLVLSNELGTPKVLLCRGDRAKKNSGASDWSTTPDVGFLTSDHVPGTRDWATASYPTVGRDSAVSYAIGIDADESVPNAILSVDSNIRWTGSASDLANQPEAKGVQYSRNAAGNWRWVTGGGNGPFAHHEISGNIVLADGSVQQSTTAELRERVKEQQKATGETLVKMLFPQ